MVKKLSVIIPNYNHGHLLRGCVAALMASTRKPDQVVIVDDGSTDGSYAAAVEIAKENLPTHFRVTKLSTNGGVPNALNAGIKLATGDYLYFLAADDEVFPDFFAAVMAEADKHEWAGIICGRSEWMDVQTGKRILVGPNPFCARGPEALGRFISSPAAIYGRNGLCTFEPGSEMFADWMLNQIKAYHHGVVAIDVVAGRFNLSRGTYYDRDKSNAARYVIRRMRDTGILPFSQIWVLGWPAYRALTADEQDMTMLCRFTWHWIKSKLWRWLPQFVLNQFGKPI